MKSYFLKVDDAFFRSKNWYVLVKNFSAANETKMALDIIIYDDEQVENYKIKLIIFLTLYWSIAITIAFLQLEMRDKFECRL